MQDEKLVSTNSYFSSFYIFTALHGQHLLGGLFFWGKVFSKTRKLKQEEIINEKKNIADIRCNKPFDWVQINNDGDVFPCCQIAQRYSIGSITKKSLEEVWNGKKYREFRKGLENGNPNPWCQS